MRSIFRCLDYPHLGSYQKDAEFLQELFKTSSEEGQKILMELIRYKTGQEQVEDEASEAGNLSILSIARNRELGPKPPIVSMNNNNLMDNSIKRMYKQA